MQGAVDLFVQQEAAAMGPGTLKVVVGRAVSTAAPNSGPWLPTPVTPLEGGDGCVWIVLMSRETDFSSQPLLY